MRNMKSSHRAMVLIALIVAATATVSVNSEVLVSVIEVVAAKVAN